MYLERKKRKKKWEKGFLFFCFGNNLKLGRAFVSPGNKKEKKEKKKQHYMGVGVGEPFITKDYFL